MADGLGNSFSVVRRRRGRDRGRGLWSSSWLRSSSPFSSSARDKSQKLLRRTIVTAKWASHPSQTANRGGVHGFRAGVSLGHRTRTRATRTPDTAGWAKPVLHPTLCTTRLRYRAIEMDGVS
jgi:hypothetical protein